MQPLHMSFLGFPTLFLSHFDLIYKDVGRAGGGAQVVKWLPHTDKALTSNPSTSQKETLTKILVNSLWFIHAIISASKPG
jgi:hypothetical protein